MKNKSKELSRILLFEWDPIGVVDEPNAQDEYDDYADRILHMIASDAREHEIKAFLIKVANEELGLVGNDERAEAAARQILEIVRAGN